MKHTLLSVIVLLFFLSVYAAPINRHIALYQPDNMSLIQKVKPNFDKIEKLLKDPNTGMRDSLVDKILLSLGCAFETDTEHKPILTIIDYSLPANQKRLWVLDLKKYKLLFHTHVSHGIKSGELYSSFFSNRHNSKASSIGVYKTLFSYYGRHGYAVRLTGLEEGFNSNAQGRAIVMHGSWYVEEDFIKKYGRPGRSWGCPALPLKHTKGIIDIIKDDALFIAYYPNDKWFMDSKFLNCEGYSHFASDEVLRPIDLKPTENRKTILFVELKNDERRERNEPILVIPASTYKAFFKKAPPLKRMLRRQIKKREYIALNHEELKTLIDKKPEWIFEQLPNYKKELLFVIPEVKKVRGYYATEFIEKPLGKIKAIREDLALKEEGIGGPVYIIELENKPPLQMISTRHFIRWLGL